MGYKEQNHPWHWKVVVLRQLAFEPSEHPVGIQQPPYMAPTTVPNLPRLAHIHSICYLPPGLAQKAVFHQYLLNLMVRIELQMRQWKLCEFKYLAQSRMAGKNEVEFRI